MHMEIAVFFLILIFIATLAFYCGKRFADEPIKLDNQEKLKEHESLLRQIVDCEKQIENYNNLIEQHKIVVANCQEKEQREYDRLSLVQEENQKKIQAQLDYLESLRQTKIAAVEALRKERQLAEDPSQHCIPFTEDEIYDISFLNQVRRKMRNPELIGKVIWSGFIQKKFNSFASFILGTKTVCGVYKITDQITQEAYIGQSVDIASRWKTHIKYGIGANTASVSNQLYAAIKRDGIENFTFELLEECSSELLNEKEKYYIGLYQTDTYGLNSTKGGS